MNVKVMKVFFLVCLSVSFWLESAHAQSKQSGNWQYVAVMATTIDFKASVVCMDNNIYLLFTFAKELPASKLFYAKVDLDPIMGFSGVVGNNSKGKGVAKVYLAGREKEHLLIARMVKGNNLTFSVDTQDGETISETVSLKGFTKAYKASCSGVNGWDRYKNL